MAESFFEAAHGMDTAEDPDSDDAKEKQQRRGQKRKGGAFNKEDKQRKPTAMTEKSSDEIHNELRLAQLKSAVVHLIEYKKDGELVEMTKAKVDDMRIRILGRMHTPAVFQPDLDAHRAYMRRAAKAISGMFEDENLPVDVAQHWQAMSSFGMDFMPMTIAEDACEQMPVTISSTRGRYRDHSIVNFHDTIGPLTTRDCIYVCVSPISRGWTTDKIKAVLDFKHEPEVLPMTPWNAVRTAHNARCFNVVCVDMQPGESDVDALVASYVLERAPVNTYILEIAGRMGGPAFNVLTLKRTKHAMAFLRDVICCSRSLVDTVKIVNDMKLPDTYRLDELAQEESRIRRSHRSPPLLASFKNIWPLEQMAQATKPKWPVEFSVFDHESNVGQFVKLRPAFGRDRADVVMLAIQFIRNVWASSTLERTYPHLDFLMRQLGIQKDTPPFARVDIDVARLEAGIGGDLSLMSASNLIQGAKMKTDADVAQFMHFPSASTDAFHVVFRFITPSDTDIDIEADSVVQDFDLVGMTNPWFGQMWETINPINCPRMSLYKKLHDRGQLFVINCIHGRRATGLPRKYGTPDSSFAFKEDAKTGRLTIIDWPDVEVLTARISRAQYSFGVARRFFFELRTTHNLTQQQKTLRTAAMAPGVQGLVLSFLGGCMRPGCVSEPRKGNKYCCELCENTHAKA